jgi:hypothetical protein
MCRRARGYVALIIFVLFRSEASAFELQCPQDQPCPQGVVWIHAYGQNPAEPDYECTGFLLSRSLVVTAEHCLRREHGRYDLRSMRVLVPSGFGAPGARVLLNEKQVRAVVRASERNHHSYGEPRDYAVLRIERLDSSVEVQRFEREPLAAGERLHGYVVDPERSGDRLAYGNVRRVQGSVVENTFVHDVNLQQASSVLAVSGIATIPGNSGAALFNESGHIQGVINASVDLNEDYGHMLGPEGQRCSESADVLRNQVHFEPLTMITNLGCLTRQLARRANCLADMSSAVVYERLKSESRALRLTQQSGGANYCIDSQGVWTNRTSDQGSL